jgi:hypothetical protein
MTDDAARVATEAPTDEIPDVIYLPDQSQPSARKRGRHFGPRPVKDPRSLRLDLRVTPAQRTAMEVAAQKAGLSLTAFICERTIGAGGPRARRNPGPDLVLLAKVLAQMGKVGANLNQIAHRMNEYDFEGIPELLAMQAEHAEVLDEHRAVCAAVLTALGV